MDGRERQREKRRLDGKDYHGGGDGDGDCRGGDECVRMIPLSHARVPGALEWDETMGLDSS